MIVIVALQLVLRFIIGRSDRFDCADEHDDDEFIPGLNQISHSMLGYAAIVAYAVSWYDDQYSLAALSSFVAVFVVYPIALLLLQVICYREEPVTRRRSISVLRRSSKDSVGSGGSVARESVVLPRPIESLMSQRIYCHASRPFEETVELLLPVLPEEDAVNFAAVLVCLEAIHKGHRGALVGMSQKTAGDQHILEEIHEDAQKVFMGFTRDGTPSIKIEGDRLRLDFGGNMRLSAYVNAFLGRQGSNVRWLEFKLENGELISVIQDSGSWVPQSILKFFTGGKIRRQTDNLGGSDEALISTMCAFLNGNQLSENFDVFYETLTFMPGEEVPEQPLDLIDDPYCRISNVVRLWFTGIAMSFTRPITSCEQNYEANDKYCKLIEESSLPQLDITSF